jgi:regulation of enolase protein 1 (concanavalin A-like superfamily)
MDRRGAIKLLGGAAAAAAGLAATGGVVSAASALPAVYTGVGNPLISASTANPAQPQTMFSMTVIYNVVARGAGLGVGNNSNMDDMSYLYSSTTGDGTWTCLVRKVGATAGDNGYSSAGIMARTSTDPGAANVAVLATDGNGVVFKWRLHDNEVTEAWPMSIAIGVGAPIWVQLQKKGYNWTVQYSQDGSTWYNPTSTAVIFPSSAPFLIGLCATTSDPKRMAVDSFSNVTGFTPNRFISIMPPASSSSSSS